MTYPEVLAYLYQQLPMYQRMGKAAYKADLSNTLALMDSLNNPEKDLSCIHVAGTNGKGSVCHYLASILQEQGLKVGLYTSPHLIDFRERIKINGQLINQNKVVDFVQEHRATFEKIGLSFFEWTVGLAFWHFQKEQVDISVIETGMGGRLDSTNVINPILSIITNISYDHQQFLGITLEKIASEKAGIIKSKRPVLIGRRQEETAVVFQQVTQEKNSQLVYAEELITSSPLFDSFHGYQKENLRTVLAALEFIKDSVQIESQTIQLGIEKVSANTGFLGRWSVLENEPRVISDVGHNEDGIQEMIRMLSFEEYEKLWIVWGTLQEKNNQKLLPLLPHQAYYFWTEPKIDRKLEAEKLSSEAVAFNLKGEVIRSPFLAYQEAKKRASHRDLILVGGSTFVVSDFLEEYLV